MPGCGRTACDLRSHPLLDARSGGRQDRSAHRQVSHSASISMIDDPPVLNIRRNFTRPNRCVLTVLPPFAESTTGFLVDSMAGQGPPDRHIKPMPGTPLRFVGTAMTCANGPADNLALAAAVTFCEAGDVLVAATDGFTGCS